MKPLLKYMRIGYMYNSIEKMVIFIFVDDFTGIEKILFFWVEDLTFFIFAHNKFSGGSN